ncbi:MAG: MBL fold metallo-hydrolase [Deltaproteobacteria bacterium]|nr:MBL fold metallo-hydrolase [Deltaproteobacteria bacterium]
MTDNCNLTDNKVIEVHPNIFLIKGENSSSHTYLLKGDYKNVLIDSGADENFIKLQESLLTVGIKIRDIDVLINTHEHFDHIGANRYFQNHAMIAAHRFAAVKISAKDIYVTMYKSGDLNEPVPRVHLWLENRFRFDLGNFSLEVIHTPGHTSGSICLYELNHNILFTGDTLFAGGSLSYIAESGSVGDYIYSISHLTTRKINEIYPGHGDISKKPEEDMEQAIKNAKALLNDEKGINITTHYSMGGKKG